MGVFYWSTTPDYSAANQNAWGLTGGTYFYLPAIPSTDWSTTADYTFAQQDLWFSKIASASNTTDFKAVAEAPEDFDILPTDVAILPTQVQVDNEDWSDVAGQNRAPGAGWVLVNDD